MTIRHFKTPLGLACLATAILASASPVRGGTVYVANNGVDGPACGSKTSPCRSITQGITHAGAGDKVVVGPDTTAASAGRVGRRAVTAWWRSIRP